MSDRPRSFPLVQVLDLIGVAAILLAMTVYLTGGFREWTPVGRISITSWPRPLLIALALLTFRHWLMPRPTVLTRTVAGIRALRSVVGVREALPIVISTRFGVLVAGFLAISLFGYRTDVDVPWRVYQNEFLNLPARWDTGWYLGVAGYGYEWGGNSARQQNIVFFPLYPMLMRYGSLLLARDAMWTGVVISWVSFFGALVYLFRMARDRFGADRALAAIALLASYPFAFFYSTAYTESLFLLTMVGACYHFERKQLWQAAVWGAACGLTRPNGCLLSIVLALMALRDVWPLSNRARWVALVDRLAVAATPGLGMLMFSTYIYFLTGNPFQWIVQNAAWGRVYRGLDIFVAQQAQTIGEEGLYVYAATRTLDAVQLVAVLFVVVSIVPVFRRLGVAYGALILVNLIPPLLMGGLLSMGRVTSILFPTFLWLGSAVPAAHRVAWLTLFAFLQAVLAGVFFTWRPLY